MAFRRRGWVPQKWVVIDHTVFTQVEITGSNSAYIGRAEFTPKDILADDWTWRETTL